MQMENIFKKIRITNYYYFNNKLLNDITNDLYSYLYDNLKNENYTSIWNLQNTLTNNANGEYI
jgi:hypothetical protein